MNKLVKIAFLSIFALIFFQSANAQSYTQNEQNCFNLVQNRVAYDKAGNKVWSEPNIRNLCKGTTNPAATISCFTNVINNFNDWNRGIKECSALALSSQLTNLSGNWDGYFPANTKTTYIWQISQTGSSLAFTDVGAGTNTRFSGTRQGNSITDSNNVTGTLSADGSQIVWANGVIWKKQGSATNNQINAIQSETTLTSTPLDNATTTNSTTSGSFTRAITLKNNSGVAINGSLSKENLYAASNDNLKNLNVVAGSQTQWLNTGQIETKSHTQSSENLEFAISINNVNVENRIIFKANLPKNKDITTLCYVVTGTYFVPNVKTCDGSPTYESKYILFKNGAGYNSTMSLTYYPKGSSTTKTENSESTALGYERKMYLPLDADTSKQMTLKANLDGLAKTLLNRDVSLSDFDTKGTTCYKVWGAFVSAKINPCNESGRKITLKNKGGYPAFMFVDYYDKDESGNEIKKSLTGNRLEVLESDSVYVPQGASNKPIVIRINNGWKSLKDATIATMTAPANFTGEICYKTEGTTINPVASNCDDEKGVADNDAREIKFDNGGGYDAEMTVTYYEYQDPNLSTAPVAKTISTGLINLGKTRFVKIPKQTAYNKTVSVSIKGYGTFKNNIYSINLPGDFAYSPKPCFTTWGTIFNPNGGKCDSAEVNKTTYEFSVKTADESGAGTDSNIYIKICGNKGCTTEQQVNSKISGNAFERNQVDKFALSDTDVGEISYIEVRSDTKYAGSAWKLEWITISTGSRMSVFHVSKWFEGTNTVRLNVNEVR